MRAALLILVASCKFHGADLPDAFAPELPSPPPDMGEPEGNWAQVAVGTQHTCAIEVDGSLWCWGYNYWNVLGTGTSQTPFQQLTPRRVGTDTWKQVAAGTIQSCAIKSDDTLWCWGSNFFGGAGTGGTIDLPAPTKVNDMTWLSISASISHTCGIDSASHRWCWGDATYGELGDGSIGAPTSPIYVNTPRMIGTDTWKLVWAGYFMTCGIKSDDTLWCNGLDNHGQLGDNAMITVSLPKHIGTDKYYAVQNRYATTCATTFDGPLQCWGFNQWGGVGDGTTTDRLEPITVGTSTDWRAFGVGQGAVCATHVDGRVECWGNDSYGEAGFGSHATATASPHEIDAKAFVAYGMGDLTSCAINDKHALLCTGSAAFGQLANGAGIRTAPQQVLGQFTRIAAGDQFTCAHTPANATACWGFDDVGQLGLGDTDPRQVPTGRDPLPNPPLELAAGGSDACELRADKKLFCWGHNDRQQLDGPTGSGPVQAPVTMPVKAVAIRDHGCAIQTDGTLACWGPNDSGQLGNGTTSAGTNVAVGGMWLDVSTGAGWTCGVRMDHHLLCWGYDKDGEVPDNNGSTPKSTPVDVGNPYDLVSAGQTHGCAIKMGDKTLWCWGFGLGDKLAQVGTAKWQTVTAGNGFTCGIQMDGSLWCWGQNNTGQLGTGDFAPQAAPSRVGTETDWTSVSLGANHACATKSNQALYCWGLDDRGQLGLGSSWRDGWQAL